MWIDRIDVHASKNSVIVRHIYISVIVRYGSACRESSVACSNNTYRDILITCAACYCDSSAGACITVCSVVAAVTTVHPNLAKKSTSIEQGNCCRPSHAYGVVIPRAIFLASSKKNTGMWNESHFSLRGIQSAYPVRNTPEFWPMPKMRIEHMTCWTRRYWAGPANSAAQPFAYIPSEGFHYFTFINIVRVK